MPMTVTYDQQNNVCSYAGSVQPINVATLRAVVASVAAYIAATPLSTQLAGSVVIKLGAAGGSFPIAPGDGPARVAAIAAIVNAAGAY